MTKKNSTPPADKPTRATSPVESEVPDNIDDLLAENAVVEQDGAEQDDDAAAVDAALQENAQVDPTAGFRDPVADVRVVEQPPQAARPRARTQGVPKMSEEERVVIELHDNPDMPPGGVYIGVNGKGYQLQPGAPVAVPLSVLGVLKTAVQQRPVYANNGSQGKIIGWANSPRWAYSVHGSAAPAEA